MTYSNFIFKALSIFFLVISLAIVIYCLHRGLDLTDEGFYLSNLYFPDRYPTFYGFGIIYTKLFAWLDPDVLSWRIIKLIQAVLGAFILSISVLKTLNFFFRNKLQNAMFQIFTILMLLNIVSFSLFLQTISYNDLNNFLTICSVACLSIMLRPTYNFNTCFWLLAAGFFEGFNFFNKATASISIGLLMSIFLVIYNWPSHKKSLLCVSCLGLGYFLAGLVFFSFFQPFENWIASVFGGLDSSSQYMAKPLDWLFEYFYRLSRAFGFVLMVVLPWLMTEVFLIPKNKSRFKYLPLICRNFTTIWTCGLLYYTSLLWGGEKNFSKLSLVYLLVIAFMLLAIFVKKKASFFTKQKIWIWLIFLFLIPLACGVGSTNSLTRQASFHTIFWGSILVYLDQIIGAKPWRTTLILGLVCLQLFTGSFDPYSMAAMNRHIVPVSLWHQNEKLNGVPNLERIAIDKPTQQSYFELNNFIKKNRQLFDNQSIFYELPGLNFITQTISPSTSWYYWTYVNYNCFCIGQANFFGKKKPLLGFLDSKIPAGKMLDCFKKSSIDFPEKYQEVGKYFLPSHQDTLRIYLSKECSLLK